MQQFGRKICTKLDSSCFLGIGNEDERIDPRARSSRKFQKVVRLKYSNQIKFYHAFNLITKDGSRVILTGVDENRDSLYIVLDKIDRKYILSESTLEAGKYD